MSQENAKVVLDVFSAIEHRDLPRLLSLCHEDVEFHWPPSLPYQRGVGRVGERFEDQVLGFYRVRERKLACAKTFYFDTAALVNFLGRANGTLLSWF